MWSTGQAILRTTTAGAMTQYSIPPDTIANGITTGSDGALWFAEQPSNIGRIATAGVVSQFPIPAPHSASQGIAAGSDGALWFPDQSGNTIGRITTSGVFTFYPIPTPRSLTQWIAPGSDGALWFTELEANQIGRITTAGVVTEYPIPESFAPGVITAGPDGALWFLGETSEVGRMTTNGVFSSFPTYKRASLVSITAGPDGALWLTDQADSAVGRMTTSGVYTEYATPTKSESVDGITTGSDHALWFTEYQTENSFKIGQAVLQTAVLSATPNTGIPGTEVTISGTGFAPNETVNLYGNSTSANLLYTAFAGSTGSFVVSEATRQSPNGPNSITGVGHTSGSIGIAPFSILAHITVNPSTGTAGSAILVSGYGFAANSDIVLDGGPGFQLYLGDGLTNAFGTFAQADAATITIPVGTAPGHYELLAHGDRVFAGAYITVE